MVFSCILFQSSFLAKHELGCKWTSFCNCIFLQKKGVESGILGWTFMHNRWTSGWCVRTVFVQLVMSYFNFEYTKAVTYTVENVGGGIGQDPATEVTNLGLFVFILFQWWHTLSSGNSASVLCEGKKSKILPVLINWVMSSSQWLICCHGNDYSS